MSLLNSGYVVVILFAVIFVIFSDYWLFTSLRPSGYIAIVADVHNLNAEEIHMHDSVRGISDDDEDGDQSTSTNEHELLSILNDTERIMYYMGKWYNKTLHLNASYPYHGRKDKRNMEKWFIFNQSSSHLFNITSKSIWSPRYFDDFKTFLHLSQNDSFKCERDDNKNAIMVWGDIVSKTEEIPIFVKARKAGNNYPIPLQLSNFERHWTELFEVYKNVTVDIEWKDKANKVVWRGAATNLQIGTRLSFVRQYLNHSNERIDVGLSEGDLCDPFYGWGEECIIYERLSKEYLGPEEMLRNKYVISLEGNDIATNLKWILYSNSCPIMPVPTRESWAMEGLLKPYVHFVPISFNETTEKWNLEQQLQFCLDNDGLCQQIAQNGKEFIIGNKFLDVEHELYLQQQILDLYCQQYNIL